jgi:hypothetical protein
VTGFATKTKIYRIEDQMLHVFGCLTYSQRDAFLNSLPDTHVLKLRVTEEQERIAKLRTLFETQGLRTDAGKVLRRFRSILSQRLPRRRRSYSHLNISTTASNSENVRTAGIFADEVLSNDLTANVIYFKRKEEHMHAEPYDHPKISGEFPEQKIPLGLLLGKDTSNPLTWKCEENMIRYFHIPSNVRESQRK